VVLPLVDLLVGRDSVNPTTDEDVVLRADKTFDILVAMALPLQYASIAFGLWRAHNATSMLEFAGITVSTGLVSSLLAFNAGHELIHRKSIWLQRAGGAVMATTAYATFKVEHVLGHHVHIATPIDGTTARKGENAYAFVARALLHNVGRAFELEAQAAKRKKQPYSIWRGELAGYTLLTLVLFALCAFAAGAQGALYFVAQALVAVVVLELVNYVEHYGLTRKQLPSGGYETTTPMHSWNANFRVSNWLLLQLQRHSDHHANAARPYQVLRDMPQSPQLPLGYASMILLALVPPLYRHVMDPRVEAINASKSAQPKLHE
jgi:alkane 1-monooxygenase